MKKIVFSLSVLISMTISTRAISLDPISGAELISVKKVWGIERSGKPHNAFTDIIRFKNQWYLGFREALKQHGGLEGKGRVRIIRSSDGEKWESCGLFEMSEGDLRDAKLSITDENQLMLNTAIQVYHPNPDKHKNFAWFSKDGVDWSNPVLIGENNIWIWSVTWHDGVAYGVGYHTTSKSKTRLYRSEDGFNWEILVSEFYDGNESSIVFKPDGTAICLMRTENAIGKSTPPYREWTWKPTINLGGPKLILLDDGRFIAGGRTQWGTMVLFEIEPETGKATELLKLPANGDSSYPGMVYHDGVLWVSYYSSSDDSTDPEGGRYLVPTEIRLAKIKLNEPRVSIESGGMDSIVTIKDQLKILQTHPETIRYRKLREAKSEDPYRPFYHFSTPEGVLNDPNGFCYWNGYYHLFYQLQGIGRVGMEWGHAYSKDLIHWQDLPIALQKDSGQIYSGQSLVDENRVIAIYHNTVWGNCIAIGNDPLLLNMNKYPANPVIAHGKVIGKGFQDPFDPNIWKQEDGYYYSISGTCKNGTRSGDGFPVTDLFRSTDLVQWEYIGVLIEDEDWVRMGLGPGDDAAVPNFHPIQTRNEKGEVVADAPQHWMFNFFSHGYGGRALIGTYDDKTMRFHPEQFYQMNYGPVYKGTLHAPSAFLDSQGRMMVIYNIRENLTTAKEAITSYSSKVWYGIMTLVRHYWLAEDGSLRMEPAGELESLRYDHQKVKQINLVADHEIVLENFSGNSLEIKAVINPQQAEKVGIEVLRSPNGDETTCIFYDPKGKTLTLDVSKGSQQKDVPERSSEVGPFELKNDELLELHIFVDRSIVEVFANNRQCLTARVYPASQNSITMTVFAKGKDAILESLDVWRMKSIWPELK